MDRKYWWLAVAAAAAIAGGVVAGVLVQRRLRAPEERDAEPLEPEETPEAER